MEWTIVVVIAFVAALLMLRVAARRAITIAELEVRDGAVRVVRGGVAAPVLADLRDVARRAAIRELHVRILRSAGRAEVELSGPVHPDQAQQIRNVIGAVPLARLLNARRRI